MTLPLKTKAVLAAATRLACVLVNPLSPGGFGYYSGAQLPT
jgi:hypothetical protein